MKMDLNGVSVARHGLILSQDGATALTKLSEGLRAKNIKIGPLDQQKSRKSRYFLIFSGPVYFSFKGEPWSLQPSHYLRVERHTLSFDRAWRGPRQLA